MNLNIEENIPELGIELFSTKHQHIFESIIDTIGAMEVNLLIDNPIWISHFNHDETKPAEFLNIESGAFNNFLLQGLWFVKDCSIILTTTYLLSETLARIFQDRRHLLSSRANGTYGREFFSKAELLEAKKYFDNVVTLLAFKNEVKPIFDGNHIISNFNSIQYNEFSKIHRALNFICNAQLTSHLLQKISWYIVALEALFSNETTEISFKLRYRVPMFVGGDEIYKSEVYKAISNGYSLRSTYLHGSHFGKENKKLMDQELQSEVSTQLDECLRKVLRMIISDESKRDIILKPDKFNHFFHSGFLGLKNHID